MYAIGAPVAKGYAVSVNENDVVEYHDIGGYIQEYDFDVRTLSIQDFNLVTNDQAMAISVWNKTKEQGFKPFYVRSEGYYTSEFIYHLTVTENHGLATLPLASVGHPSFMAIPIIWAVAIIIALIVAGIALVIAAPVIWKMAGLSPQDIHDYFSILPDILIPVAVIVAASVIGLGIYAYMKRR